MANSADAGESGTKNIFRKELKSLVIETGIRGSKEEAEDAGDITQVSLEVEKGKVNHIGVLFTTEAVHVRELENIARQGEKGKIKYEGKEANGGTVDSGTPSKETIFRKELKNLKIETSFNDRGDVNQGPALVEQEEKREFKGVSSIVGSVIGLKSVVIPAERVKVQGAGCPFTDNEADSIHEEVSTSGMEAGHKTVNVISPMEGELITQDQLQPLRYSPRLKTVQEGHVVDENTKDQGGFKEVSSNVSSVAELMNVVVPCKTLEVQAGGDFPTTQKPESIRFKESTSGSEGQGMLGSQVSPVQDGVEIRAQYQMHSPGSHLRTVKESQLEVESIFTNETKDLKRKTKSLSTGSIELKAASAGVGPLGASFDRTRKRSHVPLTMLERMEKDPIVAQHFALLESPTAETISDFTDGSQRLLNTTNRLRRTTDSVGTKYVNQYIVIKVLGCGTYGKVKLCLNTMDCKLYAVKIVHRKWLTRRSIGGTTENVGQGAMREIAIMKKLNHPNIVALHEVIDDPSTRKLYLVLEYVEGGPIMGNHKWLPFPEKKARSYFRDMCQGLDYLHFNKVVHRDLKPGNLLQTLDGRIKISDFGVSHMFEQESDSMHDTAGTPAFLAPEVCSGGECQGRPADLWSLGVCLYVMLFAKIPFPAESMAEMYHSIIHKETLILTKDPNLRISLAGIMQHSWVTKDGLQPLIPYKIQVARGSTIMSVTEDEVKAAIGVNEAGLAALCVVNPVEKQFEEGEYIIRQGEEGDEMYFINSGTCEVLVESRSLTQPSRGRMEYAVAERGPGQYVGEMAFQNDPDKKPRRKASIRAKTRVVALVVSREQVMDVLSKNAEAARAMAETIAAREREMRLKLRALDLRMPSIIKLDKEEDEEGLQPKATCSICRCV